MVSVSNTIAKITISHIFPRDFEIDPDIKRTTKRMTAATTSFSESGADQGGTGPKSTFIFRLQPRFLFQIPALADVHRGRDRIALVDGGIDALLQQSLGLENELDGIAPGALAALAGGHVVGLGLHLRPRIGHGHGKAALTHRR